MIYCWVCPPYRIQREKIFFKLIPVYWIYDLRTGKKFLKEEDNLESAAGFLTLGSARFFVSQLILTKGSPEFLKPKEDDD